LRTNNSTSSGIEIEEAIHNRDGAPDLAIPVEQYGKVAILLNTQ
jgi:hypothetical protein